MKIIGERIKPAWEAAERTLADGEWHPWPEVVDVMLASSDVIDKTCSNLIWGAARAGDLEWDGGWQHRDRRVRLAPNRGDL